MRYVTMQRGNNDEDAFGGFEPVVQTIQLQSTDWNQGSADALTNSFEEFGSEADSATKKVFEK